MKRFLIKFVVLLLVFIGSIGVFAYLMDDETLTLTEDMSKSTLPLIYMQYKDIDMNPLHGYVKEMKVTAVRDTLTPISTERELNIKVQTYGAKVDDIYFEVLTIDGSKSLENTKVTNYKVKEGYITAKFTLENKIRLNQEYVLKLALRIGEKYVYYYTRVVQQDSLHTKEYLDFVNMFSEKCLNDDADALAVYMEPEYDVEQMNLAFMDVHTTTDQLQWGNLKPQIYYKSVPMIKELNETTATILQEYIISAMDENQKMELYTIQEYFRLRYADETVMLLDFERHTNEIFEPDNDVMTKNGIILGITEKDNSFISSEDKSYFAFVQGSELWSYNMNNGKMAQVFTFRQKKGSDYRDIYGQHLIRILSLNNNGNMFFVVAGYMNRGRHEGECGVALYHYDASSGAVEEKVFVNTDSSFDLLKTDVKELAYVTDNQQYFYLLFGGSVYKINLQTMEKETIIKKIKPECSEGSRSGKYFAYLKENKPYNSKTIVVMNMDTGSSYEVSCKKKERLRMLGFLNESLVYGVAKKNMIDAENEGDEVFPMETVIILNEHGERVKEYGEKGYYVTGGEISDKLLTMQRITKNGKGWAAAKEDHIIDNTVEDSAIGITTIISPRKETEILLLLGDDVTPPKPQVVRSRMVINDQPREVAVSAKESDEEYYYVYAKGRLDHIYEHANKAIVEADALFGVVVDKKQEYIWERGNRADEVNIPLTAIPECILSGSMDIEYLQEQLPDKKVLNLAGCVMNEILYFISAGNPIIAHTIDGVRILTGYDQWGNIRYYQPGAEETYLLSDEDSLELFEKSNNIFIGFLDKYRE